MKIQEISQSLHWTFTSEKCVKGHVECFNLSVIGFPRVCCFWHGFEEYTDKISTVLFLTPLLVMPLNPIQGKTKNEVLLYTECGRMCCYIVYFNNIWINDTLDDIVILKYTQMSCILKTVSVRWSESQAIHLCTQESRLHIAFCSCPCEIVACCSQIIVFSFSGVVGCVWKTREFSMAHRKVHISCRPRSKSKLRYVSSWENIPQQIQADPSCLGCCTMLLKP